MLKPAEDCALIPVVEEPTRLSLFSEYGDPAISILGLKVVPSMESSR